MNARCRDSGEAGIDALAFEFESGRTVTRAFTADAGVRPPLLRVGVDLKGEVDREGIVGLAVGLLVLTTEFELDVLRPIAALVLILAFGRKVVGGGDRDVTWLFVGEPGREIGRDGDLDLKTAL